MIYRRIGGSRVIALGGCGLFASIFYMPSTARAVVGIDVDFTLDEIDNAVVLNDTVTASTLYQPTTYTPTFGGSVTLSVPFNSNYGQGSVISVVDLGLVDNTNPALTRVSTYFNVNLPTNPGSTPPADLIGDHATDVTKFAGGYNSTTTDNLVYLTDLGIAPLATLWSGSIVDSGDPNGTNTQTDASTLYPFIQSMHVGVNGVTADAVNASFGAQGVPASDDYLSTALDGLAKQNPHSTLAIAAGNSGPSTGTVGSPAVAFNCIAVAALASDPTLTYNTVSDYSSRGPQDFYNPNTGVTIPNARPAVDIAAPGDYFITEADPVAGELGEYEVSFGAGTSFATPLVTGAIAQLTAYAHGLQSSASFIASFDPAINQQLSDATDSRVMKAVLLNSADKIAGWNNGQVMTNGVLTTTQGLDPVIGAGRLNVAAAADNYLNGNFDPQVIGTAFVGPKGWDLSTVTVGSPNFYVLGEIDRGTILNTTLDWFADDSFDDDTLDASADRFANLYLEVFELNSPASPLMIAISDTNYNNVQELSFALPDTADYEISVVYAGVQYAPLGDTTDSEQYAIAWSTAPVPEPAMLSLLLPTLLLSRRRQARAQ